MNTTTVATTLVSSLLVAGALGVPWAAAQEPAPAGAPADEPRKLDISGFVDAMYAYNTNRPADHANFFPGVGTSAKRATMRDLAFLAMALLSFLLSWVYVRACERV